MFAAGPSVPAARIEALVNRLPPFTGARIRVRSIPHLRARHGRLFSQSDGGEAVHAGSQMRTREIVLDSALLWHPREFARIFIHEIFHFVWVRLGNQARRSWEAVLQRELRQRARGELGWSSELRKDRLSAADPIERTWRWRDYACESFCDSAAWLFSGCGRHEEFTLASRFRSGRRDWFRSLVRGGVLAV